MARRKKVKHPLPPPLQMGDLVKLIPLTIEHPKAHLIPPGSMGIVIEEPVVCPFAGADALYYIVRVKFFILSEPVDVWAAWLAKVHSKM